MEGVYLLMSGGGAAWIRKGDRGGFRVGGGERISWRGWVEQHRYAFSASDWTVCETKWDFFIGVSSV